MALVSGVGLAGLAAFSASTSSATGTAFALQAPLGSSSIGADLGAKNKTTADLAAERSAALAQEGTAIDAASADTATTQRYAALGEKADQIGDETERLRTLSKFMWPTKGGVSSVYGLRMHPILHYYRMHDGDDIGGACGQPIWAAQSGTVVRAEMGYNGGSGNNVRIDHGDINGINVETGYLHMSKYVVTAGQKVNKGEVVGYVGNTGLSTACHLHFSAYKDGRGTDPMEYIGWNPEAKGVKTEN